MSAQPEGWPRPHRLSVHDYHRMVEVGLLHPDDRRIVRHRTPRGEGYAQCDSVESGALPLPIVSAELSLTEIF